MKCRDFVLLVLYLPISLQDVINTDGELPPMYATEDFFKCQQNRGVFCKAEAFITPIDKKSKLAQIIQAADEAKYRFSKSSVHRMLCIPREITENDDVRKYIKDVTTEELENYNVTIDVAFYECNVSRSILIWDWLIWGLILGYLLLVAKSSFYDLKRRKSPNYPLSKYDKWYNIFSVYQNLDKINKPNYSPDFQRLKCIQGIRFYNTILVVACHTKLSFGHLFLDNPYDLETILALPLMYNSFQIDLFIVQIYFMISSFLLTNQILEIHRKHGEFSLYHCFNMYINRIVRFFPTLAVMLLIGYPGLKFMPEGTVVLHYINWMFNSLSHWWRALFQMNFLFTFPEMCMAGTWYISVDTFLYVTTIVLLYVTLKYHLSMRKVVAVAFTGISLIFASIIYWNNLDIMYKPYAEAMRRAFSSPDFQMLYISPYSSWSTGCVGIAMGTIYYNIKNKDIKIGPSLKIIWYMVFLLLPVCVVYLSLFEYFGISRAIVGPLLKPTFALAFGVGILGMSKGLGGIVKQIFEWDFAVKMSNFTYCTYVFHFALVFTRGAFDRGLVHFEPYNIIFSLFQDSILSFGLGAVSTVLLEMPGLALQKMYVPQIKTPERMIVANGVKTK